MSPFANERLTPFPATPRARLLVVDDDYRMRLSHAEALRGAGFEVVTAEDGATALEHVAAAPYDLVLTDRCMPYLDGASMVLALRSAGSRIPIVMVSGSVAHVPLPPGVLRELSAALAKPVHYFDVISVVEQALLQSRQSRNEGDPRYANHRSDDLGFPSA